MRGLEWTRGAGWNDQLFFSASAFGAGGAPRRFWRYDGQDSFSIGGFPSVSQRGQATVGHDGVYFVSQDSAVVSMRHYDGVSTTAVANIAGTRRHALDEQILFVRGGPNRTDQLWRLANGRTEPIAIDFLSTRILPLTEFQGEYFYLASRADNEAKLWKYNGDAFPPVAIFEEDGIYNSYSAFGLPMTYCSSVSRRMASVARYGYTMASKRT